jgi:hypothetical protein
MRYSGPGEAAYRGHVHQTASSVRLSAASLSATLRAVRGKWIDVEKHHHQYTSGNQYRRRPFRNAYDFAHKSTVIMLSSLWLPRCLVDQSLPLLPPANRPLSGSACRFSSVLWKFSSIPRTLHPSPRSFRSPMRVACITSGCLSCFFCGCRLRHILLRNSRRTAASHGTSWDSLFLSQVFNPIIKLGPC